MKRRVFLLLATLPLALCAQINDMFYVPQKEVKQQNVEKMLSAEEESEWYYNNSDTRDVDEYNRRGTATIDADNVEALLQENETYEEESDYNYSTRIVRFHSPRAVVVSSPLYWDVYPNYYYNYYDYWYDNYWDLSFGWDYCGWRFHAGYHWPYFSHHHHYPPAHHHHNVVAHPVHNRVQGRIPTASLNDNKSNYRRQPIASVAKGEDGQRINQTRNIKTTNRNNKNGNVRENVNNKKNNSTYNRRSSTSVRSNKDSDSRSSVRSTNNSGSNRSSVRSTGSSGSNRSSVRSAGSTSRSYSSPSRGGAARGGRR